MNLVVAITILLILPSIISMISTDLKVDTSDSGYGSRVVNVQIYSVVDYHGQQIYIYKSLSNDPKNQIYFYVPIMFPKKNVNNSWIWTSGKGELRVNFMFGNEEIDQITRQKIITIGDNGTFDVAPLIIDSFSAFIVHREDEPVAGIHPFRSKHPNDKRMVIRFQCSSEIVAQEVMSSVISGDYSIEFAFFFAGFKKVSTNMVSITGDSLKSVLSKTMGDGGNTKATYIHRTQTNQFVSNYLANVRKMIYKEDPNSDTSQLTSGLEEQFVSLMQQAMDNSKQEKLDLNMYGQVWSSDDLNPDRLTSELNKIFTYNQVETEYRNTSDKYFNYNEQYANSLAKSKGFSSSAGIGIAIANASGSLELTSSANESKSDRKEKTTQDIISLTDIRKFLDQFSIEIEWKGEKIMPKSFQVYKLVDITDNLQVTLTARELTAEKTNNANMRTFNTLNLPPISDNSMKTTTVESSIPIGMIIPYAGVVIPSKWLICNGSAVSRLTYSKLFSIIGTLYGIGDNETTFNLPDFRGRFILGLDSRQIQSPGLNHTGSAEHKLTIDELPAHEHDKGNLHVGAGGTHTHSYHDPGHNHGGQTGEGPTRFAGFDWGMARSKGHLNDRERHTHTIPMGHTGIVIHASGHHSHDIGGSTASVGNGKSFSIMPPSQTMNFLILSE